MNFITKKLKNILFFVLFGIIIAFLSVVVIENNKYIVLAVTDSSCASGNINCVSESSVSINKIKESTLTIADAMGEFLKGIIYISYIKVSTGLSQTFNQAKTDINVSLQNKTPTLIHNSSASLLGSFHNILAPLQSLWQETKKLMFR